MRYTVQAAQKLRSLPLELAPAKQGACRVRVPCDAMYAAAGTHYHAEIDLMGLSQQEEHGYLDDPRELIDASRHLTQARAHAHSVAHEALSILGPQATCALLDYHELQKRVRREFFMLSDRDRNIDSSAAGTMRAALEEARAAADVALGAQLARHSEAMEFATQRLQLAAHAGASASRLHANRRSRCSECEKPDAACLCASMAWHDALAQSIPSGLQILSAGDAQKLCKMYIFAARRVRVALLACTVSRLVDQNLQAIKERLWRPEGRLVQKRRRDLQDCVMANARPKKLHQRL